MRCNRTTLRVVLSMLRATDFLVRESVRPLHNHHLERIAAELQGEPDTVDIYHAVDTPPENFDLSEASDNDVKFFYGLGAEVADFSCLGRGIRDHVTMVYLNSRAELEKRGLPTEFFCDLELSL